MFTYSHTRLFTCRFQVLASFRRLFSNDQNCVDIQNSDRPYYYIGMSNDEAAKKISQLSEIASKRLKALQLEYKLNISFGSFIPENMTDNMWLELLEMGHTEAKRTEMYAIWYRDQSQIKNKLTQIEKAWLDKEIIRKNNLTNSNNTIFLDLRTSTVVRAHRMNMAYAAQFEPTLIMDFESTNHFHSNGKGMRSLAKQYMLAYNYLKRSSLPFNLFVCNIQKTSKLAQFLKWSDSFWDIIIETTPKSYLDFFPKEKLVYLTSNSPNELEVMNPDDIHILGVLYDLNDSDPKPYSYAKALREGIRTAKLPLRKHLDWFFPTERLPLDRVVAILQEYKISRNWSKAFQENVPKRMLDRNSQKYEKKPGTKVDRVELQMMWDKAKYHEENHNR